VVFSKKKLIRKYFFFNKKYKRLHLKIMKLTTILLIKSLELLHQIYSQHTLLLWKTI